MNQLTNGYGWMLGLTNEESALTNDTSLILSIKKIARFNRPVLTNVTGWVLSITNGGRHEFLRAINLKWNRKQSLLRQSWVLALTKPRARYLLFKMARVKRPALTNGKGGVPSAHKSQVNQRSYRKDLRAGTHSGEDKETCAWKWQGLGVFLTRKWQEKER